MRPRFTLMSAILKRNDAQPSSAASEAIENSMMGPPTVLKLICPGDDALDAEHREAHDLARAGARRAWPSRRTRAAAAPRRRPARAARRARGGRAGTRAGAAPSAPSSARRRSSPSPGRASTARGRPRARAATGLPTWNSRPSAFTSRVNERTGLPLIGGDRVAAPEPGLVGGAPRHDRGDEGRERRVRGAGTSGCRRRRSGRAFELDGLEGRERRAGERDRLLADDLERRPARTRRRAAPAPARPRWRTFVPVHRDDESRTARADRPRRGARARRARGRRRA